MPRLTDILNQAGIDVAVAGDASIDITSLQQDSREVQPGALFIATPGVKLDGAKYITDAFLRGASAVLAQTRSMPELQQQIAYVEVDNVRLSTAKIAAVFYPRQPQHIVAITGTNGKTSTAEFYRQLWALLGKKSASLGTLGLKAGGLENGIDYPSGLTSPGAILLHRTLQVLDELSVNYIALEASSHGLDQYRLDGVKLEAAAFTNLTHDHLDYHHDLEQYFSAKLRLFDALELRSNCVLINNDDEYGKRLVTLCRDKGRKVMTYGATGETIRLHEASAVSNGIFINYEINREKYQVTVPVYGLFQAQNICAAMGLAMISGMDAKQVHELLPLLTSARGRMERVAVHPNGAPIFVDYAHTPDALQNVLTSMRAHTKGRLHVVFGCGGDRDATKRPIMGNIAMQYADSVIVTDDNPRSENPAAIRAEILKSVQGAREIGDRKQAIVAAVQQVKAEDALIVAGKGHETYQIIGTTTYHFDDAESIKEAIDAL